MATAPKLYRRWLEITFKSGATIHIDTGEGVDVRSNYLTGYVTDLTAPLPKDWRRQGIYLHNEEVVAVVLVREKIEGE